MPKNAVKESRTNRKEPRMTILDQLAELDAQREKLIGQAKGAAMKKAEDAVAELNELGFNYRLTESRASGGGERKGTRQIKDEPCPICKFKTTPLHDRRAHRSQTTKAPFNASELATRGLARQ